MNLKVGDLVMLNFFPFNMRGPMIVLEKVDPSLPPRRFGGPVAFWVQPLVDKAGTRIALSEKHLSDDTVKSKITPATDQDIEAALLDNLRCVDLNEEVLAIINEEDKQIFLSERGADNFISLDYKAVKELKKILDKVN